MARYNSISAVGTTTGTATLVTPDQGLFTSLTGTAPYTVTLSSPVIFAGSTQTFYNATSGTVTISTPSGVIRGPGISAASTFEIPTNATVSITSNGTDYVTSFQGGTALSASSITTSGNITTSLTSLNVFDSTATTLNFAGAATALTVGATTGTLTLRNSTITASNATALNINGANPAIVTSNTGTASLFNTNVTGLNIGGAATTITIGSGTSTTGFNGNVSVATGKGYQINGSNVLLATSLGSTVVSSSLTSVGTLAGLVINSGNHLGMGVTPAPPSGVTRFIAIGDNDTGIGWISDGIIAFCANNQDVARLNTGGFNPTTTNTYDLGTASLRWRNIYTQDLHLSNGIGDYTMIEGEENLYLVNNKNGKSFKFALIEVPASEVPPKSAA